MKIVLSFLFCTFLISFTTQSLLAQITHCGGLSGYNNRNACGVITANGGLAPGSPVIFCEGQLLNFENNTAELIDSTFFCWGDNSQSIILGNSGASHIYNFTNDTCISLTEPISLEIRMIIVKKCSAGISRHSYSTPISIQVRPKVDFLSPDTVCVNADAMFDDIICENAPNVTHTWNFGDGSPTSNTRDAIHRFTRAGTYNVTLTVRNNCGERSKTKPVTVIGLPKAVAVVDSGTRSMTSPYPVCVGGRVKISGRNSINSNTYLWNSSPSNLSFTNPRDTTSYVVFSQAGNYSVILKTDNDCARPSYDTLYFRVIPIETLNLPNPRDTCFPINYRIGLPIAGATYERFLNNVSQGFFNPNVGFLAGVGTHIVVASLQNECNSRILRDTFSIVSPSPVFFQKPSRDTTVCINSDTIFLDVAPRGGTISPMTNITIRNDSLFFNPSVAGSFTLLYERGIGACRQEAMRIINVVNTPNLTLIPRNDTCYPFLYRPSPIVAGTIYKINGNVFDANAGFQLAQNTQYTVEARLSMACGVFVKTDTFSVSEVQPVIFRKPISDTTVCKNSNLIFLDVAPRGGTISPLTHVVSRNDSLFFNPSIAGSFTLLYQRGTGACRTETSRTINVVDVPNLTLIPRNDTCYPFLYRPSPIVAGTVYKINGNVFDANIGVQLAQNTLYTVEARLSMACGVFVKTDTFSVSEVQPVIFRKPLNDTTVCKNSNLIFLDVAPRGGTISPLTHVVSRNDSLFFNPSIAGSFTLLYQRGTGACRTETSRTINVVDVPNLTLIPRNDTCYPFLYRPSPIVAGTVYKINGNVFDANAGFQLAQNTLYTVEARLSMACGVFVKTDTFSVSEVQPIIFRKPISDTIICLNSGLLFLDVYPLGGTISPLTNVIVRNDSFFFNPSLVGSFSLLYERGIGACRTTARCTINVVGVPNLALIPRNDTCFPFLYRPSPIVAGTVYRINDSIFDANTGFQLVQNTLYTIEARLSMACGVFVKTDTFSVSQVQPVTFRNPLNDTTVCKNSNLIFLDVTPRGGTISPLTHIVSRNDSLFFNPSIVGSFTLLYERGIGDCRQETRCTINVVDVPNLTLIPRNDTCYPFLYRPSPIVAGTVYRINDSIFDANIGFQLAQNTQYTIEARLSMACGVFVKTDTFSVSQVQPVTFRNPLNDTTVCKNSNLIFLDVTPRGGTISPLTHILSRNDSLFFNPSVVGSFSLLYERGIGDCRQETRRTINVVDVPNLTLIPRNDTCFPFLYRPSPIVAGTVYRINDSIFDANTGFQLAQNTLYTVEARLSMACGVFVKTDTFSVSEVQPVTFRNPLNDTTVCKNSNLIFLDVTPQGGTISPLTHILSRNDSLFFNPSVVGSFTLLYERGIGDCRQETRRTINVVDVPNLTLIPRNDTCFPFLYRPSPIVAGTVYRINDSIFDANTGFQLAQNTLYTVEARLSMACGVFVKTDTFSVSEVQPVTFRNLTSDTVICLNSGLLFLDVYPLGGTISPLTNIITRNDSFFFNPSLAGSFQLLYERGIGACRTEVNRNIQVLEAPRLTLDTQATRCQSFIYRPNPIILGAVYTFNGVIFNPNTGIQAPVSPNTHQVIATISNQCGRDTQRINFNVTGVVPIQMISRDTVICRQGGNIILQAISSGGVGRWTTTSSGLVGTTFNPFISGVGTHILTYSDGVGECANSQSITIRVGGLTNIEAGPDIVLCNTRQAAPLQLSSGQPLGGLYRLNNPYSGQIYTQIEPATFPASATIYYTITDSICTSYDSLSVTINNITTLPLSAPTEACVGLPASFSVGQVTGGMSFRFFINDSLRSIVQPFDYTFQHTGRMRLALEIRNQVGCLDTVLQSINVRHTPKPMFTAAPNPVCHSQNVRVQNDISQNDTTTTYTWQFRNQTLNQIQIGQISMSNIGCVDSIYNLQLSATTGVCPTISLDTNITVYPKIQAFAGIQGPDTTCANGLVRFVNSSCGRITQQVWTIDNQSFTTFEPPAQRFSNNSDTLRIVNVKLIVIGNCATDTTEFKIWIYPLDIKARFSFNRQMGCQPFTVNFRNLTPYSAGMLWDFGDGSTSSLPFITKTYDSAGIFQVRFRVFHPCGGFDDLIDTIRVFAAPKTNSLTYEKTDICRENQIRIKPNIISGRLGRVWVDSLNLSDSTRNPVLIFPRAGTFWVKYSAIHPLTGCERIDSGQVIVRDNFQLLSVIQADSCGDSKGIVILNAVGGSGNYEFAKDDTTTFSSTNIYNNLLGRKSYSFFVRDSSTGCTLTTNIFLKGHPPLSIDGGNDEILQLGDSSQRKAIANFSIKEIEWRAIGKIGDTSIRSPKAIQTILMPLFPTRYLLIAKDSTGCIALDSFQIFIRALKSVNLADAFSPNNDGANDWFFPQTSKDVVKIKAFRIFNRWGEKVFERLDFEGNRPELGWDGTFKGEIQPNEVYAWTLDALFLDGTSTPEPIKGSVIVVR